jgi:SAM-dependent methyltransferase
VIKYDNWLEPWLGELEAHRGAVLDIGCGPGLDVQFLAARGFAVEACDIDPEAFRSSLKLNPTVRHRLVDARDLSGYSDGTFSIVTACLSLHYFDRAETFGAFRAVARVLKPDGLFLFRLNAWDDYEFGAPRDFEPWHMIVHKETRKQFFTEAMVRDVVTSSFGAVTITTKYSDRYGKRKSFFECSAQLPNQSLQPTAASRRD